jgi:DNA-binding transcriptional MerR regulator
MTLPLYEPDEQAAYTLDVVAQITGISSQTIIRYQEQGLLPTGRLNDETVRILRRIHHLQGDLGFNESGLRLILNLMDEVERLRSELRTRR